MHIFGKEANQECTSTAPALETQAFRPHVPDITTTKVSAIGLLFGLARAVCYGQSKQILVCV